MFSCSSTTNTPRGHEDGELMNKAVFDLYAGQDVRNCLVEFEVIVHNVFISGHSVGVVNDPLKNSIEIIRRKIINSIRNDIGTF